MIHHYCSILKQWKKIGINFKIYLQHVNAYNMGYQCIPEKWEYYGSCTVIVHFLVCRDFLVFNLQATFLLGFLLNFANGFLWQRSGHPILLVAQESNWCSGKSKTSKILTTAFVQAIGHSFFSIYFIFSTWNGWVWCPATLSFWDHSKRSWEVPMWPSGSASLPSDQRLSPLCRLDSQWQKC